MSNFMGKRIKQRRKELGLSQDALARRMGYTDRSIIAKFETGRSVPDNKLPELATALETTPAYLLGTLQEKLRALDITVEEDAFGNAVITDRKTAKEQMYAKSDWIALQEQEDFRKIFQNRHEGSFPIHLLRANRKPAKSDHSARQTFPDSQELYRIMSGEEFDEKMEQAQRAMDEQGDQILRDLLDSPAMRDLLGNQPSPSPAPFQETARVLSDAEIKDKVDPQDSLKENVIGGKLIPAGTGIQPHRIRWEEPETPEVPRSPEQLDRLKELLDRLTDLTDAELVRVDAFVQGILSTRKPD